MIDFCVVLLFIMRVVVPVILLLFLVFLPYCAASDGEEESITLSELKTMAENAMKDGDGYSAGLLYVQAVQREPNDVALWAAMAEAFEKAGKYDIALSAIRSCVQTAYPSGKSAESLDDKNENEEGNDDGKSRQEKIDAFKKEAEERSYRYIKPPLNKDAVQKCFKASCRVLLHVNENVTLDDLDMCYLSVSPEAPSENVAEDLLRVGLVMQRAALFRESVVFLKQSYAKEPSVFGLQTLCISLLASGAQEDANNCADLLEVADPDGTRSRAIITLTEELDEKYQTVLRKSSDDSEELKKELGAFREEAVRILLGSSSTKEEHSDEEQKVGSDKEEL